MIKLLEYRVIVKLSNAKLLLIFMCDFTLGVRWVELLKHFQNVIWTFGFLIKLGLN